MIGDDSLGLVAASREPTWRRGYGARRDNEWVIVEPGQALAAAGQERKTLLAHISSSPSLSFSRSWRSFIFIHRLFSVCFSLSTYFFHTVALSHPLSVSSSRARDDGTTLLLLDPAFYDAYNWCFRRSLRKRKAHEPSWLIYLYIKQQLQFLDLFLPRFSKLKILHFRDLFESLKFKVLIYWYFFEISNLFKLNYLSLDSEHLNF